MSDEDYSEKETTKEFDVEDIVNERKIRKYVKRSKKYITKREYLVKWLGYRKKTWEPEENLKNCKEILDKYFKRKKIESNGDRDKNMIYNQLLKLSECQKNNHSYKNFGPSFKDVMKINATVTDLERQNKHFENLMNYPYYNI